MATATRLIDVPEYLEIGRNRGRVRLRDANDLDIRASEGRAKEALRMTMSEAGDPDPELVFSWKQ